MQSARVKFAAASFALFFPLVGCQLLLDTNPPAERVIVLAPEGGGPTASPDGGGPSLDGGAPARFCPPSTVCEWFDDAPLSARGWTSSTGLAPVIDSRESVSPPFSLLVNVPNGSPALTTFSNIERRRITGTTPVKAASVEVMLKLAQVPTKQLVELVELGADTTGDSFTASLDLREDGVLSVVLIQNDVTKLFDRAFDANLLEWHRYWFKLDTAHARLLWRQDDAPPQEIALTFNAADATFDVSAGLVWAQSPVRADLSVRYDDLKVSWDP